MVIVIPHEWVIAAPIVLFFGIIYGTSGFMFWTAWDGRKRYDSFDWLMIGAGIVLFLIPTTAIMCLVGLIVVK